MGELILQLVRTNSFPLPATEISKVKSNSNQWVLGIHRTRLRSTLVALTITGYTVQLLIALFTLLIRLGSYGSKLSNFPVSKAQMRINHTEGEWQDPRKAVFMNAQLENSDRARLLMDPTGRI